VSGDRVRWHHEILLRIANHIDSRRHLPRCAAGCRSSAPASSWWWLPSGRLTMVYTVQPEERRWSNASGGDQERTAPGLHFKLPFGSTACNASPPSGCSRRNSASVQPRRPAHALCRSRLSDESLMLSGTSISSMSSGCAVPHRRSDQVRVQHARAHADPRDSPNRSCGGSSAIIWAARS